MLFPISKDKKNSWKKYIGFKLMDPLIKLTSAKISFVWSEDHDNL